MMKHMKKAISFFMAVCLLAGNSFVDTTANTSVTMSEWTQVSEPGEPLLPKGLLTYLEKNVGKTASAATDAAGGFVFYNPTAGSGEVVRTGDEVTISGSTLFLLTKVDENDNPIGFDSGVEIVSIESSNKEIAKVVRDGEGSLGYNVNITAVSPGQTSINVQIKEPVYNADGSATGKTNSYTFTCTVNVKMEIDKADMHWKTISTDNKILVLNQHEQYQVLLRGVENKTVSGHLMQWNWPNDGVIEVNEVTGTIIPKGAGVSKISLKPASGSQKAEEFTVVVCPTGTYKNNVGYDEYTSHVEFETSSESFTLYTNGNPASNMTWEVYAITYNGTSPKKTLISSKDSSLLDYQVSEIDGLLQFTNVKAGTYQVIGYSSKDKQFTNTDWNKVTFDIIVNMNLQDTPIYLGVGDVFTISDKTNLPDGRFAELLQLDYINAADGPDIIDLDPKTGRVKALQNGSTAVSIQYRNNPLDSIFAPGTGAATSGALVSYTFHVIDDISLNATDIKMYLNSTYQLIANTTDKIAPITWSSSDEKIAEVDDKGLVTAKKVTGNQPVKITATQVIDGVEKSVTCDVYISAAVTSVKLTPDNVVLDIGGYETIMASVGPSDAAGAAIHWLSSDTSIFEITETAGLTVTIQGKAGGTAVLTALNAENVVVGYCKVTVNQDAQGIKLSQTSLVLPMSQKTYQLYATITPDNTTDKKVIWASQNTRIVTIDQNGLMTFKSAGTTTVSVQSADNPMLIVYCTVTIEQAVNSIQLDYHDVELYNGETKRLSYKLMPANASHPGVIWTSFDTSVVTVDASGMLTAKGPGTTQIMIMSEENGSCYDICTVVVKQKATGVKMNYTELTMNRSEYFDMEVTVTPINSTEASLIWESLNPKVATVSSTGRITARAEGTAIILVRTQNGNTSYCTVTVLEPVISLELDPTDILIEVGEVFKIDPVFKPIKPTIQDVKWTSYNNKVATVNSLGEVEAISQGSTIITCETIDGGYRAFCLVQVIDPAFDITVSPDNYRLGYGKSIVLEATVTNRGETVENMPLIWSSSDESICTVDHKGKVTGVGFGYATIRVEIDDEFGAYATCEIRVIREVTSIRLNHNAITIIKGQSASLQADIKPSNATYNEATFSSDDENIVVVDEDGTMTAITPGTTWVWAKAKDNSGKYARCHVTVIDPIPATGITVSDKQIVLIAGESKKMVYTVKPNNTTDSLVWNSGEETIATVDGNGVITAHRTGTTTVTAMTDSGKTAQVQVIVIGLSKTSVEMDLYDNRVTLYVDGATTGIRWDSENSAIVEVVNGKLTSRKVGTTYVTATVNGRKLRCKVTVKPNKKK